jgi:hypothetical protein
MSIIDSVMSASAAASTAPLASVTSSDRVRPVPVFSMFGSLTTVPEEFFSAIRIGSDRSVPQSSSRTMTSCATSTSRRVR